MFKNFMMLVIVGLSFQLQAQTLHVTTDTITWNVDRADFVKEDSSMVIESKFITKGTSQIDWVQNGGGYTTTFMVKSYTRSWDDISNDGWILYQVKTGNVSGSIRIEQTAGLKSIRLTFIKDETETLPYTFHVFNALKQ